MTYTVSSGTLNPTELNSALHGVAAAYLSHPETKPAVLECG